MRLWIVVACFLAACGGDSGGDEPTARSETCEQMRGHIVDLRLALAHGLSASEVAQHREALTRAMGDQFVEECVRTTTDEQASCVLAASDTQAINDCNTASSGN